MKPVFTCYFMSIWLPLKSLLCCQMDVKSDLSLFDHCIMLCSFICSFSVGYLLYIPWHKQNVYCLAWKLEHLLNWFIRELKKSKIYWSPCTLLNFFINLNNMSLDKDIVTINIPGHKLIFTEIKLIVRSWREERGNSVLETVFSVTRTCY